MRTRSRPALIVAAAVPAAVLVLLLVPTHVDVGLTQLSRQVFGEAGDVGGPMWWAVEDVANGLLFLPLGVLLARRVGPLPAVALAGGTSVACEYLQGFIPQRSPDLVDVVSNTVGAAAGVLVAILVARRWRPAAGSRDLALTAGGARPVDRARRGLGRLHPVQAGGAVRHIEAGLVDGVVGTGQRGVVVPGAVAHDPMFARPSDTGRREPVPVG